ncbi:single-stranded DNA-binding protein [Streptomyces spiramenti]|uniref:Single-stranded DNA-binding protein n=1 Tax=Streptomyces spiramenti TaxID=2720606 RepID=A0ABX1AJW4_9ACTN|nr:single-stranded DNA-binding protein [Streptomyces spiramenti]NJP64893.1 single-stranded DNA-binding protein [Streptomyces spiramenti]
MNETWTTLTGHASSKVERRTTPRGARVVCFRLDVPERRYDTEQGAWRDRWVSGYTVWARRELAVNVLESVVCGEPLVVHGRLRLPPGICATTVGRETDGAAPRAAGVPGTYAHLEAVAVGHNLAHGISVFHRASRARRPRPARGGALGGGLRTQEPDKSTYLTKRR